MKQHTSDEDAHLLTVNIFGHGLLQCILAKSYTALQMLSLPREKLIDRKNLESLLPYTSRKESIIGLRWSLNTCLDYI